MVMVGRVLPEVIQTVAGALEGAEEAGGRALHRRCRTVRVLHHVRALGFLSRFQSRCSSCSALVELGSPAHL